MRGVESLVWGKTHRQEDLCSHLNQLWSGLREEASFLKPRAAGLGGSGKRNKF